MSKEYCDGRSLSEAILKGANVLADNVSSTLGPRGRNVILQEKGKTPIITKDGVTVAKEISLKDKFGSFSIEILNNAANLMFGLSLEFS